MSQLTEAARELYKEAAKRPPGAKYTFGEIGKTLKWRFRKKNPKMNAAEKYEQAAKVKKAVGNANLKKGRAQGMAAGAIGGGTTVGLLSRAKKDD